MEPSIKGFVLRKFHARVALESQFFSAISVQHKATHQQQIFMKEQSEPEKIHENLDLHCCDEIRSVR